MVLDVLNCKLLDVGGRAYRVVGSPSVASLVTEHARRGKGAATHFEADDEEYDVDDVSAFDVQEEGSEYVIRLAYDAEVLPHIIGQKGKTKLKIEQDTGATVIIPRKNSTAPPGSRDADVVLRGSSSSAVVSAAIRLELVVENVLNSNKLEYSHFVSVPLNNTATQAAFDKFKASTTAEPEASKAQVEESIFVATKQIHLTIMMLKLYSEQKRHLAKQTLHSLHPVLNNILQSQPLKIHVKGLEYMNDDPSAMHVAYVGVQDPAEQPGTVQKLQQLCSAVVDAFSDAGLLLSRDDRDVKLHATVMNTQHRRRKHGNQGEGKQGAGAKESSDGHQQRQRQYERTPFDGRWLLATFGDLDLGVQSIPDIHLSQRGKYREDGYYFAIDILTL